jgi:glutathione S-transferase
LSGLRVYRIPFSTNVERVALALAHKGVGVEWIDVDPDDRSEVVRVSGQELVPVVEHDGQVLTDSPVILEYLEERYPERPLLPADPARRAEVRVFCAWFNRVWKRAPNAIVAEEARTRADAARIAALGEELRGTRDLFEELLAGRDFLLGELSLADVTAFPFLKYAVLWQEGDPDRFHEVLREWLALDGGYPRLEAWIHRLDALPRA